MNTLKKIIYLFNKNQDEDEWEEVEEFYYYHVWIKW